MMLNKLQDKYGASTKEIARFWGIAKESAASKVSTKTAAFYALSMLELDRLLQENSSLVNGNHQESSNATLLSGLPKSTMGIKRSTPRKPRERKEVYLR